MFDRLRTCYDRIASHTDTATTIARKARSAAQEAAFYTKRGAVGYYHFIADCFSASQAGYRAAIEAESPHESVFQGLKGTYYAWAAGVHVDGLAGLALETGRAFNDLRKGKTAGARALGACTLGIGLCVVFGNLYESIRVVEDTTDTTEDATEDDMPTVGDTDIIDAEAHWDEESTDIPLGASQDEVDDAVSGIGDPADD